MGDLLQLTGIVRAGRYEEGTGRYVEHMTCTVDKKNRKKK